MTLSPRDALHDKAAELSVIGSLLIEPTALADVAGVVQPADFFLESCRYAFEAAAQLGRDGVAIDPLTLEAELTRRGHWAETGISFLSECQCATPTATHAGSYAAIVADLARKRKAVDAVVTLTKSAFSGDGLFDAELALAAATLAKLSEGIKPTAKPDRFKVTWAATALQPQPPIDWIVEPLFCAGSVSLVVGEGGTKKTYSMLDLAVAVALGQPWLGFTTTKNLALIVDEESGNRRMAGRLADTLRGHDAGADAPIGYITLACLNLYDDDDLAQFGAAVLGLAAKLVIVDALADIMPGGDENAVKDVQPIFHALRVLAEESQSAIVVIHHSNKVGTYRGSTALKGAVDLMLMVSCDGDRITFTTEKARDIEPVKFAALANFGPGLFNLSPATPEERAEHFSKSESYVRRYLSEHGLATMQDIQDHADSCTDNAARRAVFSLANRGKVRRVDSGGPGVKATYALTEPIL